MRNHDGLIDAYSPILERLQHLAMALRDNLRASETKVNTIKNKEPAPDGPTERIKRFKAAIERYQVDLNKEVND
jgi:hypothetical protein